MLKFFYYGQSNKKKDENNLDHHIHSWNYWDDSFYFGSTFSVDVKISYKIE